MTKSRKTNLATAVVFVVCAVVLLVFNFLDFAISEDKTTNTLAKDTIQRLVIGLCMVFVLHLFGYGLTKPFKKGWARCLLVCLPCVLVAVVNFPFGALISGQGIVTRADILWLFLLQCFAVGLSEETVFRGIIFTVIAERFAERKNGVILSVVLSGAVFGLAHVVNLFYGGGFGATMLQVGYSFLIGCMLCFVLLETKDIWVCVFIHALFDVGGKILVTLGEGDPWDVSFWVLTVVVGVGCGVYVLLKLLKTNDLYVLKSATPEN